MTNGIRRESRDPDVVQRTIEAKEKLAVASEEIIVEDEVSLETMRRVEASLYEQMVAAHKVMNAARRSYRDTLRRYREALGARQEKERSEHE
jgi:hypothetical protein